MGREVLKSALACLFSGKAFRKQLIKKGLICEECLERGFCIFFMFWYFINMVQVCLLCVYVFVSAYFTPTRGAIVAGDPPLAAADDVVSGVGTRQSGALPLPSYSVHGSSSHRGQQSPGLTTGCSHCTGGQSIGQQSTWPPL